MQLSEIRTRLSRIYGNTITADDDYYDEIINDIYRDICAMHAWHWLETFEVVSFNAPVVADKNYTNVLGPGNENHLNPSASADVISSSYNFGWAYTGEHTYRITTVETSGSDVVLDANLIGDDATATAFSCTFWNDMVTLSTAVDHVVQVVPRSEQRKPLKQVDLREIEQYGPNVSNMAREVANVYALFRETVYDTDQIRMRIYPPPDEDVQYTVRYYQNPTALSSDSDVPIIPVKHHSVIVDLSMVRLLGPEGVPQEISFWENQAAKSVARLYDDQTQHGNKDRSFKRRGIVTAKPLRYKLSNCTLGDPV